MAADNRQEQKGLQLQQEQQQQQAQQVRPSHRQILLQQIEGMKEGPDKERARQAFSQSGSDEF